MFKVKPLVISLGAMMCGMFPLQVQAADSAAAGQCPATDMPSWFAGPGITAGGAVNPANSITFQGNNDCDFLKWGAQMFLWLTSPADNDTNYVFNGESFFQVIPDSSQNFVLALDPATKKNLSLRAAKKSTGQAGGGDVLVSRGNSLVYYGIHINNVYAFYKWGPNRKNYSSNLQNNFPTSQAELDQIESFPLTQRRSLHIPIKDDIALAMEIKTSWVEASSVANSEDYVTITAEVPEYTKTTSKWTPTGTMVNKKLALVGMHVVGSVNGHPELVWATFEHKGNAPDLAYYVLDQGGSPIRIPFTPTSDAWNFYGTSTTPPTNIAPMATAVWDDTTKQYDIGCITAGCTIGSVDVARLNPWGSAPDDASVATLNTEFVTVNVSVQSQLASGDVRKNYLQTGSIWSSNGSIPTSGTYSDLAGSLRTANTTMETFHQYPDNNNGFVSNNCFTCHNVAAGSPGNGVSHIFSSMTLPKD